MVTLYLPDERIKLQIDDIEVHVCQLTAAQKMVLLGLFTKAESNPLVGLEIMHTAVRYCLKDIKGVKLSDGSDFKLEFDDKGNLQESCVDALMNITVSDKLAGVCAGLFKGFNGELTDHLGEPIPGVSLIGTSLSAPTKKKRSQNSKRQS